MTAREKLLFQLFLGGLLVLLVAWMFRHPIFVNPVEKELVSENKEHIKTDEEEKMKSQINEIIKDTLEEDPLEKYREEHPLEKYRE